MSNLERILTGSRYTTDQITAKVRAIKANLLQNSRYVRDTNFQSIHPKDLESLFDQYDSIFFQGLLVKSLGRIPLRFRLSRRLTSAAGTTTKRSKRKLFGTAVVDFEITISTTLLFQTFGDVDRVVTASGVECRDRLDALQRVFEHELIHLAEMLVWSDSNCAASRFQGIARGLFGHREHTHQLITQRERALTRFGLKVGDRVTFRFDGKHYEGILNRVTRRATVLVEDAQGRRYSNGKRYAKFYVSLDLLRPVKVSG